MYLGTLFQTDVLRRCLSSHPNIPLNTICYGIGRLSECPCAQYQFALLVALRKEIAVRTKRDSRLCLVLQNQTLYPILSHAHFVFVKFCKNLGSCVNILCVGCCDVALVTSVWESINLVWTSSVYIRLNVCLFVPLFNHFVRCLCHPQVGETLIYDPILVEEELLVAEKLGFSRIQQNEVCL